MDNFQVSQPTHPSQCNRSHPPPHSRNHNENHNEGQSGHNLQLAADFDGRKTPLSQGTHGPSSTAYVLPIGQDSAAAATLAAVGYDRIGTAKVRFHPIFPRTF
jgi:hypothetical protein